jgi:glycosyltransferase involved in cell wall biosynthesis
MKLLVDARVGWGHGIGRVVANAVPRIAGLHPEWSIDVLVGSADVTLAEQAFTGFANLAVRPCPVTPFSPAEQWRLSAYADGYDLTWFTNYWVPLRWRGRFVATVHDMLHLMPEYLPSSRAKRMLARQTFAKVRRDARAVMFVSRFTQAAFADMIGAPRCGEAVQLGGDHLDYGVLKPIAARPRRVMVVAASKKHKNFTLLLDAWRQAKVADHWMLTIISPGSALRSSIDIEGLISGVPRTEILRDLPNAVLAELYADSAILVMPSLYEGFGLPLIEGLRAGALCLSSNAGAMVEVAEGSFVQFVNGNDRIGWTAAIEAACAAVDQDNPLLDAIQRHNIAQADRLRWSETAASIARIISTAAR